MCPMEKGVLASCEITYFPIQSKDYIEEINKVIEIIGRYKVEVKVGIISTTIRGNSEVIFSLVKEIFDKMAGGENKFTISLKISNTCGCQE